MTAEICNPALKVRYNDNSSFRSAMNQNLKKYNQKLQQSYYSDLSKVNINMLQISTQKYDINNINGSRIYQQKKKVIYIYSQFQPQNDSQLHKFFLYFIGKFPHPKQPYYLIYVNSFQTGKGKCWSKFKSQILQQLPLNYLLYLDKLILIRPSLLDKASSLVQFGVLNKFFRDKTQKYDSLKDYFDEIKVNFAQVRKLFPQEVLQQQNQGTVIKSTFSIPLICKINENRTSFQMFSGQLLNLQNTKQSVSSQKHKKIKKGLQHYPTGQLGIPLALQLLLFYFTQRPQRCQTEGIFRKCTSIDDEQELVAQLQKQNYQILTQIQNNIAVASAIKRFISTLQPPIIPYESYQKLVQNHSLQNLVYEIHKFPIIHFMTLMHLLKFLIENIIPKSKKNLMTLQNISICFAPCLMKSRQISQKQFIYATINVRITKILLEKFDDIFGDKEQQRKISRRTYKIFRSNSKRNQDLLAPQNNYNIKISQPQKRLVSFGCPQDFLKPAQTLFQNQKQSQSQRYSQFNNQQNDFQPITININNRNSISQNRQSPISEQIQKIKSEQIEIIQSNMQKQQYNHRTMKKHRSSKQFHTVDEDYQVEKQVRQRKSACDKQQEQENQNQVATELISNVPNQNCQTLRLNKLRANRSKMGKQ